MKIFEKNIYFNSIHSFYPRVCHVPSPQKYLADNVVHLTNINIFTDCKCNIAIYMVDGNAFYVDVNILNQSNKKRDLIDSFLKTEKSLENAYGMALIKQGKFSWILFERAYSKRRINNAVIEHHLYEHFDFRETITVKFM